MTGFSIPPCATQRYYPSAARREVGISLGHRRASQRMASVDSPPAVSPAECPACGEVVPDGARFCSRCGRRLVANKWRLAWEYYKNLSARGQLFVLVASLLA